MHLSALNRWQKRKYKKESDAHLHVRTDVSLPNNSQADTVGIQINTVVYSKK